MAEHLEFYRETEFKDTEIGRIPKDWPETYLANVSLLIMGQSPPSNSYNNAGIGLPFLQGKAEFGEIYPSPTIYSSKPIKVAEKGDILISVHSTVKDVNIPPTRICIGKWISANRSNKTLLSNFIFYSLKFFDYNLPLKQPASTLKEIRYMNLKKLFLYLQLVKEWQRPASIISATDQKLKLLINKKAKLEIIKQGFMNLFLTKKVGTKHELR